LRSERNAYGISPITSVGRARAAESCDRGPAFPFHSRVSYSDIAALVHEKHRVGDWWSQTVTVGYERIKGLRERGQRRGGAYEATKSRTFKVSVKALFRAWADDATRHRWIGGVETVVRTATAPKSLRLQWPDGTIVAGSPRRATQRARSHSRIRSCGTGRRPRRRKRSGRIGSTYWPHCLPTGLVAMIARESGIATERGLLKQPDKQERPFERDPDEGNGAQRLVARRRRNGRRRRARNSSPVDR
jgi:hypothetical protein